MRHWLCICVLLLLLLLQLTCFVFRIFIHYYLHRRSVLTQLTGDLKSTARKATENFLSSSQKVRQSVITPIRNLSEHKSSVGGNSAHSLNSETNDRDSGSERSGKSPQQRALNTSSLVSLVRQESDQADRPQDLHSADGSKRQELVRSDATKCRLSEVSGGINASFDGIVVADLDGIITDVNDTSVELFGYSSKIEMIGKNLSILAGGKDGKVHDGRS